MARHAGNSGTAAVARRVPAQARGSETAWSRVVLCSESRRAGVRACGDRQGRPGRDGSETGRTGGRAQASRNQMRQGGGARRQEGVATRRTSICNTIETRRPPLVQRRLRSLNGLLPYAAPSDASRARRRAGTRSPYRTLAAARALWELEVADALYGERWPKIVPALPTNSHPLEARAKRRDRTRRHA